MLNLYDLKIAEQHQRKLETEAANWRKANPKDDYKPNLARRRKNKR